MPLRVSSVYSPSFVNKVFRLPKNKFVFCFYFLLAGGNLGTRQNNSNKADDTGSLSVILVVILPVAQMFLLLTIIVLLRICYRKLCLSRKKQRKVASKNMLKAKTTSSSVAIDRSFDDENKEKFAMQVMNGKSKLSEFVQSPDPCVPSQNSTSLNFYTNKNWTTPIDSDSVSNSERQHTIVNANTSSSSIIDDHHIVNVNCHTNSLPLFRHTDLEYSLSRPGRTDKQDSLEFYEFDPNYSLANVSKPIQFTSKFHPSTSFKVTY